MSTSEKRKYAVVERAYALSAEGECRRLYRQALEECCALLKANGVPIRPWVGDGEELYFDRLPVKARTRLLSDLSFYVQVAAETQSEVGSLTDEKRFLWNAIKRLGLRPTSDLMGQLENEDLIEIYRSDHIQIYRNLQFFKVCSYTLDEVLCRPWWELFSHPQEVTDQILEVASRVFGGSARTSVSYSTGSYVLEEVASPQGFVAICRSRFLSPLFDADKRPVAAVNVVKVEACRRKRPERSWEGEHVKGP